MGQGNVPKLGTASAFSGGLPKVGNSVFGGFDDCGDSGTQKFTRIFVDFGINQLAVNGTGYKHDSGLMPCNEYSAVGNFFNSQS